MAWGKPPSLPMSLMATTLFLLSALALLGTPGPIAMSPVPAATQTGEAVTTFTAGLLLGISNPKAYLGFMTLFASQTLISGSHAADALFKWLLTVAVILVVDIAWLYVGARLGRISLSARTERYINVALGMTILAVALYSIRALV